MSGSGPGASDAAIAVTLAAGLGLAADYLLWHGPMGPGFVAWIALLGVSAVVLTRGASTERARSTGVWAGMGVLAACIPALRASPELWLVSMLVLIVSASMVIARVRRRRFGRTRVSDHAQCVGLVPALAGFGAMPLLARAQFPTVRERPRAAAFGRGALLAIPPVVVFGALFAAADPVFEAHVHRLSTGWWDDMPAHIALVLGFGWIAGGLLWGVLPGSVRPRLARLRPPRLGVEEVVVVLGAVAVLFAIFVAIQLPYFFGGRATVEATAGLTLATYARRGFFELVAVAGLVLLLLLVVSAASPRGAGRWVFRSLAALLLALVMLVIASAALRLRMYVAEFGLTTSRFYGAAFMAWLAASLLWFGATVVRGRPRRFAAGGVVAGLVVAFGLAAANPDAVIARTNLARAADRPVDVGYLSDLSADAVPTLLAGITGMAPEDRCAAARSILARWSDEDNRPSSRGDWRRWNAASARADRLVAVAETRVRPLLEDCPTASGPSVRGASS